MPKIPLPSRQKPAPENTDLNREQPAESNILEMIPNVSPANTTEPDISPKLEEIPPESPPNDTQPDNPALDKEMPSNVNKENCVTIDGQLIELKPTKLKYFRNKAASGYGVIKSVPIQEFLTIQKGVIDEKRDADQVMFDFLVSAFDDSAFVRTHYDDMTADDVEQVVKIFGRLNHIDEKEEQIRKNKEAQAKR